MEAMREKWTDERMDDLSTRVGEGFNRLDTDLRALRSDTASELGAVRAEMRVGFDRVDERFDAMHRTMVQFAGAMIGALIALFAAQLGLIVSLL